jgi:quercetin dioxygenase-like cupin family protein
MTEDAAFPGEPPAAAVRFVPAGEDRFGQFRGLGVSSIAFKVTPQDSDGTLVLENVFHAKGGPPRHVHHDQDEWFYALESEFVVEAGAGRHRLRPGDAVFLPRGVPHVWAHVGESRGRILVAFFPAGKMEAFFREVTRGNAMPPQDPELWSAHGMTVTGPPLKVD